MSNRARDDKDKLVIFNIDRHWNNTKLFYICCCDNQKYLNPHGSFIDKPYSYKSYREAIGILKKYFKISKVNTTPDHYYTNAYANFSASEFDKYIS